MFIIFFILFAFPVHIENDVWTFEFVLSDECVTTQEYQQCVGIVNCGGEKFIGGCISRTDRLVQISITDLNLKDEFDQTIIEHELRHIFEPNWNHNDEKYKVIVKYHWGSNFNSAEAIRII